MITINLNEHIQNIRQYITENVLRLFIFFLLIDFLFISIYILRKADIIPVEAIANFIENDMFSLVRDGSYVEIYQYIKMFLLALFTGLLAYHKKSWLYLGWAVLFVVFLLDDSLRIHERLGEEVAELFDIGNHFGFQAEDLGELLIYALIGIPPILFIMWHYFRYDDKTQREVSNYLILLIFLLIFFAVGVDLFHSLFTEYSLISVLLGIVEDGSELIIFTPMVALMLGVLEVTRE